ncbi:MAG: PaaI family thioesterase, partial [Gaiellaceae bacterium]
MDTTPRHTNPMGTTHGGILCDLADGAMGMAWASELEEGETFTTLELKINYLKPVWSTHLRAEANVVKRGRTIGLV